MSSSLCSLMVISSLRAIGGKEDNDQIERTFPEVLLQDKHRMDSLRTDQVGEKINSIFFFQHVFVTFILLTGFSHVLYIGIQANTSTPTKHLLHLQKEILSKFALTLHMNFAAGIEVNWVQHHTQTKQNASCTNLISCLESGR